MHILEIEKRVLRLKKFHDRFVELLDNDADYCSLMQLPSGVALKPYDRIRGANLRARLEIKYGSAGLDGTLTKLDQALLHIEDTINSVARSRTITDHGGQKKHEKSEQQISNGKSICQLAVENAVALARETDAKQLRRKANSIAVDKKSTEQVQMSPPDQMHPDNFGKLKRLIRSSTDTENDCMVTSEDIVECENQYLPIPTRAPEFGKNIAYSMVISMALFGIGVLLPHIAETSTHWLQ